MPQLNMSTLSKVLLVLVILASFGLIYMGFRAYGTLQNYGKNYQAHVDRLAKQDAQLSELRPRLAAIRNDLDIALKQQTSGRVWYGQGALEDDGAVKVTVAGPLPPSVDDNAGKSNVLQVYETWVPEGMPEGADPVLNYLGQFKVTFQDNTVEEKNITLAPAKTLSAAAQAKLAASVDREGVRWMMFEEMPADNYGILAGKSREEIAAMFPKADGQDEVDLRQNYQASIDDLVHHGQAATNNDPPGRVMVSVKFSKNFADLTQPEKDHLQATLPSGDYEKLIEKDKYARFSRAIADQLTNPANGLAVATVESPVDEQGTKEPEAMYMRDLRDFDQIFRDAEQDLIEIIAKVRTAELEASDLEASVASLNADVTRKEEEVAEAEAEKTHMENERDLAIQVVADRQSALDTMLDKIAALRTENAELAAQLREAQLALATAINERTGTTTRPVSTSK